MFNAFVIVNISNKHLSNYIDRLQTHRTNESKTKINVENGIVNIRK